MGMLFSVLHGNGPADLNDCYGTGLRRGKEIATLPPQQTTGDFSARIAIPNNKARSIVMN
jgi:hypothetical protein